MCWGRPSAGEFATQSALALRVRKDLCTFRQAVNGNAEDHFESALYSRRKLSIASPRGCPIPDPRGVTPGLHAFGELLPPQGLAAFIENFREIDRSRQR